jgi:hypothetical protein
VVASRDSVLSVQELPEGGRSSFPDGMLVDKKQDFSIEAVFDEVESMVNRRHASHSLSFDGTYGYPDSFAYDGNDGQGVRSGTAVLTLKGYLGRRFAPVSH